MKKLILVLITGFAVSILFGQETEKHDYCNCIDEIEQVSPVLHGQFKRKCNEVLVEKGEFVNGLKNGVWVTYSRTGKLIRQLNYDNGLLNGKAELFYINGEPKLIGQFENSNKTGRWVYYTEKGKILLEGSYDSNKPIGIWTINNDKGKKPVVKYDYDSKSYLVNKKPTFHEDGEIIQNDNTEEWYILKLPDIKYSSKTEPLGGYSFANYMFIELVEVPENYWDTYLYHVYKVMLEITSDSELTFDSQLFSGELPDDNLELTFLIITNESPSIKKIKHSNQN
jgi:hypothetical protein